METQTDMETDRHADRQTCRQTDRHADRQTDDQDDERYLIIESFVWFHIQLRVPPPFLFRVALIEIAALSFMVGIVIEVNL